MSVLAFMIPIALILGLVGLGAFIWSIKSGQYDDLQGAALRILIDDERPIPSEEKKTEINDENKQKE